MGHVRRSRRPQSPGCGHPIFSMLGIGIASANPREITVTALRLTCKRNTMTLVP